MQPSFETVPEELRAEAAALGRLRFLRLMEVTRVFASRWPYPEVLKDVLVEQGVSLALADFLLGEIRMETGTQQIKEQMSDAVKAALRRRPFSETLATGALRVALVIFFGVLILLQGSLPVLLPFAVFGFMISSLMLLGWGRRLRLLYMDWQDRRHN